MASTNQSPFYQKAESNFLSAKTDEDKVYWLDEMIKECPKHKSAEKMLANLKTRRRKLVEKMEIQRKVSKGSKKPGIKKEDMQAAVVGFKKSGKSSLLSLLTNAKPEISNEFHPSFTTKSPEVGIMEYGPGVQIQLVEVPAVGSEYYDKSTTNSADTILILIESLDQIKEIWDLLERSRGKKIIVFNKSDKLSQNEKRKIISTLRSKKYNFVVISISNEEGIKELKDKIFKSFGKMRIYTKEPGKERTEKALVLDEGKTVKDVAEKILHGFSKNVKESFVTGPSGKFPNQKVGLKHVLRDLDVIEFRTR